MSTLNQYRYRASTRVPTRMRPATDCGNGTGSDRSLSRLHRCDGFKVSVAVPIAVVTSAR